jgi:hypothetical protein
MFIVNKLMKINPKNIRYIAYDAKLDVLTGGLYAILLS